jgi:hypothetical protein
LQIEDWQNGVMQNVRNVPVPIEKKSVSRNRDLILSMLEDSRSAKSSKLPHANVKEEISCLQEIETFSKVN